MGLLERNMVKHLIGSSGGTLLAEAGESFRVKDVFCQASANDTYVTLAIDGKAVNKIRVAGKSGSHLPYPASYVASLAEGVIPFGLFAYLRGHGFDLTIPVPSGSILSVSRYAEAGDVALVYDRYAAGDVKADEPNGPLAKVLRYLHYGTNLIAVTATPCIIDTSLIWTGGDKWPFDATAVPGDMLLRLCGILAPPIASGNNAGNANTGYSTHLRMYREGDMLFDSKDQTGIPFLGDVAQVANARSYKPIASVIGPMTSTQPKPGFMLSPPLDFPAGDKLTTHVAFTGAAAQGVLTLEMDFCLLLERGPAGRK